MGCQKKKRRGSNKRGIRRNITTWKLLTLTFFRFKTTLSRIVAAESAIAPIKGIEKNSFLITQNTPLTFYETKCNLKEYSFLEK